MKKLLFIIFIALLSACSHKAGTDFIITVSNEQDFAREELIEVPISDIADRVALIDEEQYIVLDADSNQIPYQISYDDKLLFLVSIEAKGTARYKITVGEPIETTPTVYGRHYPERADDIAWENERVAYRTYGPALQHNGERAYGYDVWVKRVPYLVVEQRYATELNPEARNEIQRLRKERRHAEADELSRSISYHVDHGDGLDCYKVGATLGCGTAALMNGDAIIYPYCWDKYEILDNGPLRFTVKLTYLPFTAGRTEGVVETRIISLDSGSQLNKTVVSYEGLEQAMPIATGLVIHPENPEAYVLEADKGYIAYADLTDNVNNDNGIIYIGTVTTDKSCSAKVSLFSPKEYKERGALGHVLSIGNYRPESQYTYYWGAGWSKYGFNSMDEWTRYLERFAQIARNPLKVEF